jgi:hypothetical protein
MLGVTYKSARFMAHWIRYAMTQQPLSSKLTGTVEVDETYIGGKRHSGSQVTKPGGRPPFEGKQAVVSVSQRGERVQSRHVEKVSAKTLRPIIDQMLAEDAHLVTDTSTVLASAGSKRKHSHVNHTRIEYSRYEGGICLSTNTVEGYFSIHVDHYGARNGRGNL